jgi:hypothetical protein
MQIRFISSVTPEDENAYAPIVLKVVASILDQLPIAYTIRIETAGAEVHQHTHPPVHETALHFPVDAHLKRAALAD